MTSNPTRAESSPNAAFRNLLVGTDFTPASKLAFRKALQLARHQDAGLHLVHVANWPGTRSVFLITQSAKSMAAVETRIRERSKRRFEDFLRGEPLDGITLRRELRLGRPHQQLLEYAREHDVDLIVLGERPESRAQHLLQHLLFESVGKKIRREALCAVLTVR